MCSGTTPGPNLQALGKLVAEAADSGASYVLSPEMTVAFARNRDGLNAVAEPFEENAAIVTVAELARTHRLFLHLGSLAVALEDGRFANRSVLLGPDGAVVAIYDKIHLFDATLPGQNAYRESASYRPGTSAVIAPGPGFSLGMTVCYDVRFPALFAALAGAGAEVLSVPAAFTVPTGEAHWHVLLRARAIETGSYVIAAAQSGTHENGRATYGHSLIVDPWGVILAECEATGPGVVIADLDLSRVAEARERVPALANARSFSLSVNHSARNIGAEGSLIP